MTGGASLQLGPAQDLADWMVAHAELAGYLASSVEAGRDVKTGIMNLIAAQLGAALGCRYVRGGTTEAELIKARTRRDPSREHTERRTRLARALDAAKQKLELPSTVSVDLSDVVRIEERVDVESQVVKKFTGVVVTVSHPATFPRYLIVNFEESESVP